MNAQSLSAQIEQLFSQMRAWRRDIHQHPESAWQEVRTASLVAKTLADLGYDLQLGQAVFNAQARMGLPDAATLEAAYLRALEQGADPHYAKQFAHGFTGIVATLDSGRPGPTIGYRFDLDALDLCESDTADHVPTTQGFQSENSGMMHACGHDGHTAIGLGLATLLAQLKGQWHGRVKLIFQPAEEGVRGAKAMAEAGVVDNVDYFTAIHIGMGIGENELVCGNDVFMATSKLDVHFSGVAAHAGARPEEGHNALLGAAQATVALHGISRHSDGVSRINVGVLEAGTSRNIIAPNALLKLETRGRNDQVNNYLQQQAEQIIAGVATMYGLEYQIELMGAARACESSPQWVEFIHQQAQQSGRFRQIVDHQSTPSGSEDATYFMQRVKDHGGMAAYSIFGSPLAAGHHNESFDFDESVMANVLHTLVRLTLNIAEFSQSSRGAE